MRLLFTVLLFVLPVFTFAQDEQLEAGDYIGVEDCDNARDIKYSPDGSLILASCSLAPRSMYFSQDGGLSWTYARGGKLQYGTFTGEILITESYAFTATTGGVLRSALPSSSSETWIPNWTQFVSYRGQVHYIRQAGNYLLVSREGSTDELTSTQLIDALGLATGLQADQLFLDVEDFLPGLRLQFADGFVFLSTRTSTPSMNIFRAPFDSATGTFGSITALTADSGLPEDSNVASLGYDSVEGRLYYSNGATLFSSKDFGASFVEVVTGIPLGFNLVFSGKRILAGRALSLDGGDNWIDIRELPVSNSESSFIKSSTSRGVGAFHPTEEATAVFASNVGLVKTSTLGSDNIFVDVNPGLQAVVPLELKQAPNETYAALRTRSGLALTSDITAENPSWTYPICVRQPFCPSVTSAVFHPTKDNVLYAVTAGAVFRLDLDFSGDQVEVTSRERLGEGTEISSRFELVSSKFAPTKLFALGSFPPGVQVIDLTDESLSATYL